MKNSFVVMMVLCAANALAMPTKEELAKAQSLVVELMADDVAAFKAKSKKAEEIGDTSVKYAQEASTEAAKFLLLKGAISYYVRGESYDKAADAVNALREAVPDVPPDVLEEIIRKNTARVTAKKAPRLYAIYQTVQVQVAAAKEVRVAKAALSKKPKDEAAIRKLAEAQVLSGDWKAALGTFAKLGSKSGAMAKSETEGKDLPSVADFWWDYESYLGEEDADAFKAHAAAIYRQCLADGSIDGLKKKLIEKRIEGYAELTAPSGPVEEKQLTYEGYLPETNTLLWEGTSVDAIQEFTATFAGKHVTNPARVVGHVVKSGKGWKEVQFQIADDAFLKCIHAKFVQKGDSVCGSAVKAECADSAVALGTDFTTIKSVRKYWLCFSDKGEGYGIKDLTATTGKKRAAEVMGKSGSDTIDLRIVGADPIRLIKCPAGAFKMGFENGASPFVRHNVKISRPFWMSEAPITVGQYCALMGMFEERFKPRHGVQPADGLRRVSEAMGGASAAISGVTLEEIAAFCGKLSAAFAQKVPQGCVFRLPTDAEWAYAFSCGGKNKDRNYAALARGEKSPSFAEIAVDGLQVARKCLKQENVRFCQNEAWMISIASPRYRVKTCRPNAWGFYDMAGLCWERLADTVPPLKNRMHSWSEEGKALFVNQYVQHANGQEVDPVMVYDGKGGLSVSVSCNGGANPWLKLVNEPGRHWDVGFRLVIGPDLVSEWKAKNAKK